MLKKFTAACSLITACLSFPAHAQFSYTETFLGDGLIYQPLNTACRITDSRQPNGGGAVANNATRSLTVMSPTGGPVLTDYTFQGGRACTQHIPSNAEAVMASVQFLPTTGAAFMKLMANGVPAAQGNTIAGQGTNVAGFNAAYGIVNDMVIKTKTGAAPHMDVFVVSSANPAHFVIDVAGYFYRRATTCTGQGTFGAPLLPGQTAIVNGEACQANFALGNGGCEQVDATNPSVSTTTGIVVQSGLRVSNNKPYWRCTMRNSGTTAIVPLVTSVCCNGN
jgi:hypothetical protein